MATKLPEAVQRQLEDAERIESEQAAQAASPPEGQPADPPPETPPAPPEPPPPTEDWQHKFQTLQGKYNSETSTLRQQVEELTQKVNELTAKPTTPEPPPAEPPPNQGTDADVDAFGADLVDLMRRIAVETDGGARKALQAEIDRLKALIPDLQTKVQGASEVAEITRRRAYFASLKELVDDYETVNVDPAFVDWLSGTDPLSGLGLSVLLGDAFEKFDVVRTAKIFEAFKKETGRAPTPPAPTPEPEKPSLEAEVSPGQSGTSTVITPDDGKKIWSSAEVHEFYTAVTRGDYRGRQEEARRIDAEIDRALIENRVRS